VLGPDGEHIGKVIDLRLYPSVDALLIERADGSQAELPLVAPYLREVDVATKRVVLSSLDGLMDSLDGSASKEPGDGTAEATTGAAPAKRRYKDRKSGRAKREA
jgi:hypothetical protein